jgi:hypothetical protein
MRLEESIARHSNFPVVLYSRVCVKGKSLFRIWSFYLLRGQLAQHRRTTGYRGLHVSAGSCHLNTHMHYHDAHVWLRCSGQVRDYDCREQTHEYSRSVGLSRNRHVRTCCVLFSHGMKGQTYCTWLPKSKSPFMSCVYSYDDIAMVIRFLKHRKHQGCRD